MYECELFWLYSSNLTEECQVLSVFLDDNKFLKIKSD